MDAGQADGPGEGRVDVGQRVDFWEEQGSTALKGSDESLTPAGLSVPGTLPRFLFHLIFCILKHIVIFKDFV